jgi:hypothetical protein
VVLRPWFVLFLFPLGLRLGADFSPPCPPPLQPPGFITGYVPACALYFALNFFFPHFPTLLAAAVTADDVDTTVEPVQDGSWDGKSTGHDYEMGQLPDQQHHVNY